MSRRSTGERSGGETGARVKRSQRTPVAAGSFSMEKAEKESESSREAISSTSIEPLSSR